MAVPYGRGPPVRLVDRRRLGVGQELDRAGALAAVRPAAVRLRPPYVGAPVADAAVGLPRALDGRALRARDAGANARVVRRDVTSPDPADPRGSRTRDVAVRDVARVCLHREARPFRARSDRPP